ncbi:MAG: pyridoxamine 5'-phosphate oxidase family protein [bacterium]
MRTMRRFKPQITDEECQNVLKTTTRGVLSVYGEDGYPYGMPLNHYYDEASHKIYFHGAKEGHKVDAFTKNPHVSFCVMNQGTKYGDDWFYTVESVVVFGRMQAVEDEAEKEWIARHLAAKFPISQESLEKEIASALPRAACYELTIDHMTGKRVREK